MARPLLVSYCENSAAIATKFHRRLQPGVHLELGVAPLFAPQTVRTPADLLAPAERAKILEDGIAWLKGVPKVRTDDGTVAKSLVRDGVSLWWWLEAPFWFGNPVDSAFPPMSTILESAEVVRRALESGNHDRVVFAADRRPMVSLVVRDVAAHFGLPFSGRTGEAKVWVVDPLRHHLIRLLRLRRRKWGSRAARREARALLVSHLNAFRRVGDRHQDVYLGPLARVLSRSGVSHAICYVNTQSDAKPLSRLRAPDLSTAGFLLEQAISSAPADRAMKTFPELLQSWKRVEPGLVRSLRWRGIALPRILPVRIGEVLRRHAHSAVYYLAAFRELFERWEPEVVVVTNETGYAGRAAVAACRSLAIRSVGVQHGLISPQHIEYIHDPEMMNPESREACPYPDLTALDGSYYQGVLTEVGSYPKSATRVTGQMRYEVENTEALDSVPRIRDQILIATQPFDREIWLADVLEACRNLGQVVIKPHPLEDLSSYRRLISRQGGSATIVEDIDLPKLLRSSGILITQFSTIVVEAALQECPCIIYNPQRRSPPVPFVELGGATEANSTSDLRHRIGSALQEEEVGRRLAIRRSDFLTQVAFGGMTGSAQRLADLIFDAHMAGTHELST